MLTPAPDGLANDLGGFLGPHERCGVGVPVLDVVADVLNQPLYRHEGPAPYRLAGQDPKPRFDHVQPGGAGGREMEADVGMSLEPLANLRGGMGGGVIQDHVELASAVLPVQY